jgi:N-acetylneuraminic acid mutarotase
VRLTSLLAVLAGACATDPGGGEAEATSSSSGSSSSTDGTTGTSSTSDASSSSSEGSSESTGGGGSWQPLSPMPTPRSDLGGAVVDGLVYLPGGFGGRQSLEAYDPANDEWIELADLPEGRDHAATAALDGIVYVVGGIEGITSLLAYDTAIDAWEFRERMPHPRTAAAAIAHDGALWIVGGTGAATDDELREVLRYDPARDVWTSVGSLPEPREHLAAVALDDRFHLLGGRWEASFFAATLVYDPSSDTSQPGAPLIDLRGGFQAAVIAGSIFAAGGEVFEPEPRIVDAMEVLDPDARAWQPAPPLPVGVFGHAVVTFDGVLIVIGGSDFAGGVMNMGRVWAFVP